MSLGQPHSHQAQDLPHSFGATHVAVGINPEIEQFQIVRLEADSDRHAFACGGWATFS